MGSGTTLSSSATGTAGFFRRKTPSLAKTATLVIRTLVLQTNRRIGAMALTLALTVCILCGSKAELGYSQSTPPPPPQAGGPYTVVIRRGDPVVIGYWLVVEGPDKNLGIDSQRGIEIAIDDRNRKILGHPVQLVGENEGCNATEGRNAAARLAANPQVIAVIGSSCSSAAVPGAPILWQVRIPTVSPSNTAPQLTDPTRSNDYSGYLRTSHNNLSQGRVAAQFAYRVLRARRAATIRDGSPYAERLQAEFTRVFRQLSGEIVDQQMIGPADLDMSPILGRIAGHAPDLIYTPIPLAAGSLIAQQARSTQGLEDVRLMGADSLMDSDFLRAAGPAAHGVFMTSPDLSPGAMGPRYQRIRAKYSVKYGEPVSVFHAHAYDAAAIILAAIEKVARRSANGSLVVDRVAVRNALFAMRGFAGATGILTCNPSGDCADSSIAVYQITSTDRSTWNPGANPKKLFP